MGDMDTASNPPNPGAMVDAHSPVVFVSVSPMVEQASAVCFLPSFIVVVYYQYNNVKLQRCRFFQLETHISGTKATNIARKFGFSSWHLVEGVGFSGGIWVLWNDTFWCIEVLESHRQFVHLRVAYQNELPWFLIIVYGSPHIAPRADLWSNIRRLAGATLYLAAGTIQRRLDKYVANKSWSLRFFQALVKHLSKLKSNHVPILLNLDYHSNYFVRPFHFLSPWLVYRDFHALLINNWRTDNLLEDNISSFMSAAKIWNNEVFGNIAKRKSRILARLNGISANFSFEPNPFLENLQSCLWKELEDLLIQEEIYWKQCSRCKWLNYGDRNTSYFHGVATSRKRRNRVSMLKDQAGVWIEKDQQLQDHSLNFFQNLYTEDSGYERLEAPGFLPTISEEDITMLTKEVTIDEIRTSLFVMGPGKLQVLMGCL
ncbi:uncharacterized protein [Arachis hypogaea]|uniref:uncharacterized protein n=1 Tax=Arachis hypogaea TaxID=3818 RepID=UPI003B219E88